jgi:hypothetical protein
VERIRDLIPNPKLASESEKMEQKTFAQPKEDFGGQKSNAKTDSHETTRFRVEAISILIQM